MTEPLLQATDVSKVFRRRRGDAPFYAVKRASLDLFAGERVAIVGESGSGKSTLARCLLLLHPCEEGEIRVDGRPVGTMKGGDLRRARASVQPIFQDASASFNPRERVRTALARGLSVGGVEYTPEEATRLLESVGLRPGSAFLERYPHELSGGQRQRLAIARCIAARPRVVIADEPLSGADVSVRGQVLNLMLRLQEETGVAYLLITHDIAMAAAFADRVYVMRQGEVVESGAADDVLSSPVHEYTRKLVGVASRLSVPIPAPAYGHLT